MKFLCQIICTFIFIISFAKAADEALQINVTYVPPVCPVKSKDGDMISTDYTGTFENGTVFDTRYG